MHLVEVRADIAGGGQHSDQDNIAIVTCGASPAFFSFFLMAGQADAQIRPAGETGHFCSDGARVTVPGTRSQDYL